MLFWGKKWLIPFLEMKTLLLQNGGILTKHKESVYAFAGDNQLWILLLTRLNGCCGTLNLSLGVAWEDTNL